MQADEDIVMDARLAAHFIYHKACGGMFIIIADTPHQNGMNYCCYCGRTLAEADGRETPNTEDEQ